MLEVLLQLAPEFLLVLDPIGSGVNVLELDLFFPLLELGLEVLLLNLVLELLGQLICYISLQQVLVPCVIFRNDLALDSGHGGPFVDVPAFVERVVGSVAALGELGSVVFLEAEGASLERVV